MAALRVNEAFAERYGRYRRREELQRLRDRYGDSGSSGDSDSSSSDEEPPPRLQKDFFRTLSLLKTKDPRIYQQETTFYESSSEQEEERGQEGARERPAKPMFLKDYERKVVLEKEGKYVDEEDEEDKESAVKRRKISNSWSYAEEQRELKESFRAFIADSEEDEEEGGGSALLRRRERTAEEKEQEEEDYIRWLKGQGGPPPEEPLQDLLPLRRFWADPGLAPAERFLRDYLLEQQFHSDQEEAEGGSLPALSDSEEEGESFLQRQEDFERRHNFRFQEPDGQQIQSFPRHLPSSVRRRDERRKEKRERRQERKRKEREKRQEELKQLKNLKRQEVSERLLRLQKLTGGSGITQSFLEGDFDPDQYDQFMASCFGDDYYGHEEEEKPQFEEEEGLDDNEDDWNWDNWTGRQEEQQEDGGAEAELHCEDPDFVMDADYDPVAPPAPERPPPMGKKRQKSRFREALERQKPTFDPSGGSFEQYVEQFYALESGGLPGGALGLGGALPCRFRYRSVVPCDFGLSTDEILAADDKELNRWCPLRKTCMYRSEREERQDQANYSRRAQNLQKKQQIFKSLMADPEEPPPAPAKPKVGKKRRDRLRRSEELGAPGPPLAKKAPLKTGGRPRCRGWGAPLGASVRLGGWEFSGKRLEAFGLNPRRLQHRQLQRQQKKRKGGGKKTPPGATPQD